MSLLFAFSTLRSIRRTFPTARTFRPDQQPNGVAYKHSSERPYQASKPVKQLPSVLPNTWRANRAAREAKTLWINNVKKVTGKGCSQHTANDGQPLQLFIDHRPEITHTKFFSNPNAIVFPRSSSLGQRLSKLAHSTPWSERSRWITWPTYALVAFYSLLFMLYILCRERVPITGRSQFMIVPLVMPPSKDSGFHLQFHDDMMKMFVPEDDQRVARAHSVLDRLLSASGLSHLQWMLLVLDAPGEWFSLLPQARGRDAALYLSLPLILWTPSSRPLKFRQCIGRPVVEESLWVMFATTGRLLGNAANPFL